jgi:CRP-like cAMP-binding protein
MLAPFDERTLLRIAGDSANLLWPAGRIVFARGTPTDGLYIVLSGRVRVVGDNERELNVLGRGEYFGEFSLLLGTTHQYDVYAVDDCELLVVPRQLVEELLAAYPDVAESIRHGAEERRAANLRAVSR